MDESELPDWLDRHHVDVVRTHATNLDGLSLGKYVHRGKFLKTLPRGHAIADFGLAMDIAGTPHLTMWHPQRETAFGDIYLKPDLGTLISDGTDAALGHCICDFVTEDETPIELCPRGTLKRMVSELADHGLTMKATFEIEFYLFDESFDAIRRKRYKKLTGVAATQLPNIYVLRSSYHATAFMREVISRLEWKGIRWEGWNDEAGPGQFELNLEPTSPVEAADIVMRVKQILYEVAVDMGLAVTFMSRLSGSYGNGMHIHHSLLYAEDDRPAFFDESRRENRSGLMEHWLGGLLATLPGAVSFLCPTINSFRRVTDYAGAPTTADWGEQNKSTALRTVSSSVSASRIEYRLGAGELNPYLALAVIIAGGIAGLEEAITPGANMQQLAWGLPDEHPRLPNTIMKAKAAASDDDRLKRYLGAGLVDYWVATRELEWLTFHTEGGDPQSTSTTEWEYDRYFSLI